MYVFAHWSDFCNHCLSRQSVQNYEGVKTWTRFETMPKKSICRDLDGIDKEMSRKVAHAVNIMCWQWKMSTHISGHNFLPFARKSTLDRVKPVFDPIKRAAISKETCQKRNQRDGASKAQSKSHLRQKHCCLNTHQSSSIFNGARLLNRWCFWYDVMLMDSFVVFHQSEKWSWS